MLNDDDDYNDKKSDKINNYNHSHNNNNNREYCNKNENTNMLVPQLNHSATQIKS